MQGRNQADDSVSSGEEHAPESGVADRRANRSLIGRQGAYALHARYDGRELTQRARDNFLARFIDDVDPHRELPDPTRQADPPRTGPQTARRRTVSERTARRLVHDGELRHVRIGRRLVRVLPEDGARYVERRREPSVTNPGTFTSRIPARNGG